MGRLNIHQKLKTQPKKAIDLEVRANPAITDVCSKY